MYKCLKFNLARNSLRYLIRLYGIKKIYLPYYLCNVVRQSVLKENCKPLFYHIKDNFMPEIEFKKTDFILYPDYFGICRKNTEILAEKYPNLIIDNSHAFYSEPKGLASFNSVRKFLPLYNGSHLFLREEKNLDLPLDLPLKTDDFRETPKTEDDKIKAELSFENEEIKLINPIIDEKIKEFKDNGERKEKFLKLHEIYLGVNELKIDTDNITCPFTYPCLLKTEEDADNLVKTLNRKGINIIRYWNVLPKDYNEYKFYSRLVAIPII
ncbi:hypothetical protein IJI31_01405 [bacterium]|nr:hypothetical protein [bacterium]